MTNGDFSSTQSRAKLIYRQWQSVKAKGWIVFCEHAGEFTEDFSQKAEGLCESQFTSLKRRSVKDTLYKLEDDTMHGG